MAQPPPGRQQRTPPRIAHRLDLALARLAPLPALADAAEPELGDDAGGGRVVDEVAARQTAEARWRRSNGQPARAPPRSRSRGPTTACRSSSRSRPPVVALDVADGADERAVVLDAAHELVVAERGDPQIGINERVGVGNAGGHARNVPVAGQCGDAARIGVPERAVAQSGECSSAARRSSIASSLIWIGPRAASYERPKKKGGRCGIPPST